MFGCQYRVIAAGRAELQAVIDRAIAFIVDVGHARLAILSRGHKHRRLRIPNTQPQASCMLRADEV